MKVSQGAAMVYMAVVLSFAPLHYIKAPIPKDAEPPKKLTPKFLVGTWKLGKDGDWPGELRFRENGTYDHFIPKDKRNRDIFGTWTIKDDGKTVVLIETIQWHGGILTYAEYTIVFDLSKLPLRGTVNGGREFGYADVVLLKRLH